MHAIRLRAVALVRGSSRHPARQRPEQPDDNREPALQPPSSQTTVRRVGEEGSNEEAESTAEEQRQQEDIRFVRRFTDYEVGQYLQHENDGGPDSRHHARSTSLSMGTVSSIRYTMSRTVPSQVDPGDLPTVSPGASGGTSVGSGATSGATTRPGAESTAPRRQHVNIVVMLKPTTSSTDKSKPGPSSRSSPKKFDIPVPRAKSSFEVGSLDKSNKQEYSGSGGCKEVSLCQSRSHQGKGRSRARALSERCVCGAENGLNDHVLAVGRPVFPY
ncbi:hypothetical protein MRX96_034095 [Rhipicephalus microplus]